MSASSEQIFIGIDVSKASLDLAIRAQSKACQFANTEEGIGALLASLEPLRRSVAVVLMEATGGLEYPAAVALCVAGYPVMVVNPRQAHDFSKSLGYLSKTDAQALAQFAHTLPASGQASCCSSWQRQSKRCWPRWSSGARSLWECAWPKATGAPTLTARKGQALSR
jgi:transposase